MWMSLGLAAVWELLEEFSVALSVWTGNPSWRMKQEWDQADTMFDLFCAMLGISFGILFVWIINSPRLVRYPMAEVVTMRRDYGIECIREDKMVMFSRYVPREYVWIRTKYWVEMFIIEYIPSRAFIDVPDNSGDTYPGPLIMGLFREDWLLYFVLQMFCIGLCFVLNWTSFQEQEAIWGKDFRRYWDFHLAWAALFGIFMAPSVYMSLYPKMMVMIQCLVLYAILIPMAFYVRMGPIDFRKWKWKKWTDSNDHCVATQGDLLV